MWRLPEEQYHPTGFGNKQSQQMCTDVAAGGSRARGLRHLHSAAPQQSTDIRSSAAAVAAEGLVAMGYIAYTMSLLGTARRFSLVIG